MCMYATTTLSYRIETHCYVCVLGKVYSTSCSIKFLSKTHFLLKLFVFLVVLRTADEGLRVVTFCVFDKNFML